MGPYPQPVPMHVPAPPRYMPNSGHSAGMWSPRASGCWPAQGDYALKVLPAWPESLALLDAACQTPCVVNSVKPLIGRSHHAVYSPLDLISASTDTLRHRHTQSVDLQLLGAASKSCVIFRPSCMQSKGPFPEHVSMCAGEPCRASACLRSAAGHGPHASSSLMPSAVAHVMYLSKHKSQEHQHNQMSSG